MNAIRGKLRDLGGGFVVRRVLPSAARQGVGPFVFFDHFGPIDVAPGANHDVRPHPHIDIATVTYLFEGAFVHRDSLGFAHYPAAQLPEARMPDITARVLIGRAFGVESPVRTFADTLYVDVDAKAGVSLDLGDIAEERAIYSVDGALRVDGIAVEPFTMAVIDTGAIARIESPEGARYVIIGGAPVGARRHMEWNFVSSRAERIDQAKRDWAAQRMGAVPGETEWIPLP